MLPGGDDAGGAERRETDKRNGENTGQQCFVPRQRHGSLENFHAKQVGNDEERDPQPQPHALRLLTGRNSSATTIALYGMSPLTPSGKCPGDSWHGLRFDSRP